MEIIYIVTDLAMGGTQGWVEYAALELVKQGHIVKVIAEQSPHDRKIQLENKGVSVYAFDSPRTLDCYREIICPSSKTVIHLNIWTRFSELIRLRELCNTPLALSYHSAPKMAWKHWLTRVVKPSKKNWGIYPWFTLNEARRFIDAHIGCCETSAIGIRKKLWPFFQNKVYSLRNAIPLPEQITQAIISGPPRFLQVGALNERKNPFLTLKSFEIMQEFVPESSLTFVGNGHLYAQLEDYIRVRGVRNVFLKGEVFDTSPFFKENNVLVLPSKCEGLPYSLIEGAGYGIPIIASDVDGIPEVCIDGFNGILLRDQNLDTIFRAMFSLATNTSMREKMGKNGRDLVIREFEIGLFTSRLLNIYNKILERHNDN